MSRSEKIFFPQPLRKGDKIALLSPATSVKEEYVAGAMDKIQERGYEAVLMPHAIGHVCGSYSANKAERLMDIFDALEDPEIKAILCCRGGYGCCQLLENLSLKFISTHPKWIIGFSDVSALLALWHHAGVAAIHGPMAKHIATMPQDDICTQSLFDILQSGVQPDYSVASHPYNRKGLAAGTLLGGNFAVLDNLSNTPYDILNPSSLQDSILFLEDIGEPIYKVNRMLWHLHLSGALKNVKGLIFGQFTDYKADKNFETTEEMIHSFLKEIKLEDIPVAYNFPVGHTDHNLPLIVGDYVDFSVKEDEVRIQRRILA